VKLLKLALAVLAKDVQLGILALSLNGLIVLLGCVSTIHGDYLAVSYSGSRWVDLQVDSIVSVTLERVCSADVLHPVDLSGSRVGVLLRSLVEEPALWSMRIFDFVYDVLPSVDLPYLLLHLSHFLLLALVLDFEHLRVT
jgi:hypothetical protein